MSARARPPTVAVVGPDGAGKTSVARALVDALPVPARYLYMGVNLESSNLVLPTTRLALALKRRRGGAPDMVGPGPARRPLAASPAKRALAGARAGARLVNWLAEEWFRQAVAWWYRRQGNVVVFDRHFLSDYHATDVAGAPRRATSRVHGFVLRRLYPRPDLMVYLDAPAEVLFARKGQGTLEWLEQRRRDYLRLRHVVPRFEVVDANRPLEHVVRDVAEVVLRRATLPGKRRP